MAKIFENNLTATKMKQVRNKMRTFSIHERMPEPPKMVTKADVFLDKVFALLNAQTSYRIFKGLQLL